MNAKRLYIGNGVFAVLILVATILFSIGFLPKYFIKTFDSALFVLCGVFNIIMLYKIKGGLGLKPWFMLIGLIFAFIGDVLLIEPDLFLLGAIFFAIGHIFFLVYFYMLQKFNWLDIIISVVLFVTALLILLLYPSFNFGDLKIVVIIYALIITFMLGKALSNFICKRNIPNLITFIGAFLFFFSDVMLVFYVFGNMPAIFDTLCLLTYYPAEFLLAISIILQGTKEEVFEVKPSPAKPNNDLNKEDAVTVLKEDDFVDNTKTEDNQDNNN
ncbi:MAG: lysoplasmalogenase [Clostridia bacterium]|nr:lysoplasmalogenase [Clostridia bacterium]